MEIRPEVDNMFHADRRTQMTKLMVGFRNLRKRVKIGIHETAWRSTGPVTSSPERSKEISMSQEAELQCVTDLF
jgi:hypothetical protein